MNVNVENTSALRRKLTVELEPAEIKHELDKAYNELRRTVQLKGFRPGHAPQKLLERFFGDQVRGDVIQRLVRDYTEKALDEQHLKPMVTPEIVTEESDLAKALRFSAIFDVRPELVVKDYEGLKVPRAAVTLDEDEVENAIERTRERHATLKKVEERTTVAAGDFALAELEGAIDGKPVPELKLEERLFEVSDKSLAHKLEEVLIGAEVGQQSRKSRSYPEDYGEKALAGKTVEWRATVKEIFQRELPTIDDEFAKDQGFKDLDEMRGKLRESLLESAKRQAENRVRQGLLELVIERNPFDVPDSLIDREQRLMEAELAATLEASGIPHEDAHGRAHEQSGELRPRAEKRARTILLIDALADQEHVALGDDEVAERIGKQVREAGRERDRVAQYYADENNRSGLRDLMRREKTVDLLMNRAQVEEEAAAGGGSEAPQP
ncbi:MAG: trigger factor [Candidatus Binataceae bacterium]